MTARIRLKIIQKSDEKITFKKSAILEDLFFFVTLNQARTRKRQVYYVQSQCIVLYIVCIYPHKAFLCIFLSTKNMPECVRLSSITSYLVLGRARSKEFARVAMRCDDKLAKNDWLLFGTTKKKIFIYCTASFFAIYINDKHCYVYTFAFHIYIYKIVSNSVSVVVMLAPTTYCSFRIYL